MRMPKKVLPVVLLGCVAVAAASMRYADRGAHRPQPQTPAPRPTSLEVGLAAAIAVPRTPARLPAKLEDVAPDARIKLLGTSAPFAARATTPVAAAPAPAPAPALHRVADHDRAGQELVVNRARVAPTEAREVVRSMRADLRRNQAFTHRVIAIPEDLGTHDPRLDESPGAVAPPSADLRAIDGESPVAQRTRRNSGRK